MIFDAAVVMPTILRPELGRAVRSVFAQDFPGSVQILIGVDIAKGPADQLAVLKAECPANMQLVVIDPGYSTSKVNGGFYELRSGGVLKTAVSFLANSRYVAYLDDDNWWAPNHLSSLRTAIEGHDWAFSYRWYVDPDTDQPICVDRWESVGPGRGMYARLYNYNGHVDTNCYMIDKSRCHWALPAWSVPHEHRELTKRRGGACDRSMFRHLQTNFKEARTGMATVFYVINKDWQRVVKYLVDPKDPALLKDPREVHFCQWAGKVNRAGVQIEAFPENLKPEQ